MIFKNCFVCRKNYIKISQTFYCEDNQRYTCSLITNNYYNFQFMVWRKGSSNFLYEYNYESSTGTIHLYSKYFIFNEEPNIELLQNYKSLISKIEKLQAFL